VGEGGEGGGGEPALCRGDAIISSQARLALLVHHNHKLDHRTGASENTSQVTANPTSENHGSDCEHRMGKYK
jgi:hypothetical protein